MIGSFTFKRDAPGHATVSYEGPAGGGILCYLVKEDGKWTVPGTPGTFKDRWHAAYAYLKLALCEPTTRTIEAETKAAWDKTPRRPMNLTADEAGAVYDLLVSKCGAYARDKDGFVHHHADISASWGSEWRFGGLLGSGGKFYVTSNRWYVSNYSEDTGPEENLIIAETNAVLQQMYAKTPDRVG